MHKLTFIKYSLIGFSFTVEESSARLLSLGSVTVLAEQLKKTDKEDYLSRLSHIIAEMAKNGKSISSKTFC